MLIDLHIHTNYSDGQATIPEVFKIAALKKLNYFAITDHFSTSSKQNIIKTLSLKTINEQIQEIKETSPSYSTKYLLGIEIDCESNFIDIEDLPLEEFDLINFEDIFSIDVLKKVCNLIIARQLKGIFCLAHPDIHLYNNEYPVDNNFLKTQLIPLLNEHNIAFELNFHYKHRWLDLEERIKILTENGVKFSIGSDAHSKSDIGNVLVQYKFLKRLGGLNNIIKINI